MENKSIPQSQTPLGFFKIIKESFKTTRRNAKVVGPFLLLVFVSSSLLDFGQKYILAPAVQDLVLQLAKYPNMVQDISYNSNIDQTVYAGAFTDIREILLVKLLFMACSSMLTITFLVAIISSSYEAHTAKVLHPKDLTSILLKTWKRPLLTSFYMILLSFGTMFLYLISIGIATILAVNAWGFLFVGAIALSIPVCYFYMAALWIVSMVVSVLEEGFSGIKAIGRAAELMNGKRLKASLMMLLFSVAYGFFHKIANVLTGNHDMSMSVEMAIRIPLQNGLFCMLTLFMFVVYTVFYHEWKTIHDEKEGQGYYYLPVVDGEA